MKRHIVPALTATLVALSGCSAATVKPLDPPVVLPQTFTTVAAKTAWVAPIADPVLVDLVQEALRSNPDLAALASQVEVARASAWAAGANLSPQVSISGETSVQAYPAPQTDSSIREEHYAFNGLLSWEIDLWGRLRAERAAAWATFDAMTADFHAAQLSLAGTAAHLWIDIVDADAQTALASRTLETFEGVERIAVRRFEGGVGNSVDVHLARANTASARQALVRRKQQRDALARTLEALLGRYPDGGWLTRSELPPEPDPVSPGMPASLLERRPDVRAAATRYEAASQELHAARRARLPALRLTGSAGHSSPELGNILRSDAFFRSLAVDLTAPILDGGRLSANRARAEAQLEAAAHTYAATVLEALREVETALAASARLHERQDALEHAAQSAERAQMMATDRYRRGLVPFSTVLEAQRRTYDNRSRLLEVRAARHKNHVDLILTLGGDMTNGVGTQTLLQDPEYSL